MIEARHPLKLLKRGLFVLCLILNGVYPQLHNKQLSACELETILKELVYPEEGYGMHAYQLRNQLSNLLENYPDIDDYQPIENDLTDEDKRSLSSLAKNGLLVNGKRHIGSLGNLNLFRPTPEDVKKSIATLAKNGQLPSKEPETDETPSSQWSMKRNVAALARSGLLSGKRNVAALARNSDLWLGKRNLASIVRTGMRPPLLPKRNLASLARGNMIPYFGETKKNVGTLARDWSLPKTSSKINIKRDVNGANNHDDKRNIGSYKNSQTKHSKVKRDVSFEDYPSENTEILEPVYQTSPLDLEKYNEMINDLYPLYDADIHDEKRFLGRVLPPTRATSPASRGRL